MFVYNILVFLYGLLIKLAAGRDEKAKLWVSGRKNWRNDLLQRVNTLNSNERLWLHCASYGEFEQGRPLLEKYKLRYPKQKIILTFFSPSGYEAFKNWQGADMVFYLPLDTPTNAKDFVNILKPSISIFIKYEYWLNVLKCLKKNNVPTYLVAATFKPHQPFFKWYGEIFKDSLSTYTKLFVQDENSKQLLEKIGVQNYALCGDTRFDRVIQIKENFESIKSINDFKSNNKLIVAGSTWADDETFFLNAVKKMRERKCKIVLAPHNVDSKSIEATIQKLKKFNFSYALFSADISLEAEVLIIDSIGLLSRIYFYADCAYVGGGFNGGLHSTLEPAVYGVPVLFYGEHYVRYNEAVDLLKLGVAKKVDTVQQLVSAFEWFLESDERQVQVKQKLKVYFEEHANVSDKILDLM